MNFSNLTMPQAVVILGALGLGVACHVYGQMTLQGAGALVGGMWMALFVKAPGTPPAS